MKEFSLPFWNSKDVAISVVSNVGDGAPRVGKAKQMYLNVNIELYLTTLVNEYSSFAGVIVCSQYRYRIVEWKQKLWMCWHGGGGKSGSTVVLTRCVLVPASVAMGTERAPQEDSTKNSLGKPEEPCESRAAPLLFHHFKKQRRSGESSVEGGERPRWCSSYSAVGINRGGVVCGPP